MVFGIIMLIAGAIAALCGFNQNNSVEAQLGSILSSGSANPGTVWIVIGAILAVIGLIVVIASLSKKND